MFLNELLVKHSKFFFINTLNTIPIPYAISLSFNQFFQLNLLIYRITIHLFFQITLTLKKTGSKFVIFKNYRTIESCDRFPKSQGPF